MTRSAVQAPVQAQVRLLAQQSRSCLGAHALGVKCRRNRWLGGDAKSAVQAHRVTARVRSPASSCAADFLRASVAAEIQGAVAKLLTSPKISTLECNALASVATFFAAFRNFFLRCRNCIRFG